MPRADGLMGRRHQGGRPHRANGHARPQAPLAAPPTEAGRPRPDPAVPPFAARAESARPVDPVSTALPADQPAPSLAAGVPRHVAGHPAEPAAEPAAAGAISATAPAGCTAPQLRRFIKSRPYVPMHELRRRFGINGVEDEVSAVDLPDCRIFVGLPEREGALLGELLRAGDVGYELSLDPRTPIVVGLYPMRPVPRS